VKTDDFNDSNPKEQTNKETPGGKTTTDEFENFGEFSW